MTRASLLAAVLLTGCAWRTPPPDTAHLPTQAFGTLDADIGAVNVAQFAFSSASRLRGRPSDAARAVAAIDYLGGEISTSPRWDFVSPLTKVQLLEARAEVRRTVGIAPGASSQDVTRAMLRLADAIDEGDRPAEAHELAGPLYDVPPATVYAHLDALPYLSRTNIATQRLAGQINGFGGGARDE